MERNAKKTKGWNPVVSGLQKKNTAIFWDANGNKPFTQFGCIRYSSRTFKIIFTLKLFCKFSRMWWNGMKSPKITIIFSGLQEHQHVCHKVDGESLSISMLNTQMYVRSYFIFIFIFISFRFYLFSCDFIDRYQSIS